MTEEGKIEFRDCVLRSHPTGSRYICNPAPTDTDNDTVFLVNGYHDWQTALINDGWDKCGDYEFAGRFEAYRKGEENYICTEDEEFFKRYIFATEAAKALNLLNKEDRIKCFEGVANAGEGYLGFLDKFPKDYDPAFEFEPLGDPGIYVPPRAFGAAPVFGRPVWEPQF